MTKRNTFPFAIMAMVAVVLFSSCAGTGSITKRYHSNGYQVNLNWFGKDKKKESVAAKPAERRHVVSTQAQKTADEPVQLVTEEPVPVPATAGNTCLKEQAARVKAAVKTSAAGVKTVVQQGVEELKPAVKEIRPAVKKALKTLPEKKNSWADDNQLIAAIVAIFIPFLGVLIYEGSITTHFWISLLLTLLFFLPGMIYALLVIFGAI
jgi:uncharacterized membrane protein YqaE (UPF0057 family)